jgi:hydrogenase maturation protease
MQSPQILVAGIGNIFLGDDGFGCAVIERLKRRGIANAVRVTDFGIRGLDLAYALFDGYDVAILVDAVSRGGKPGTLYIIEPELNDPNEESAKVDPHGMNPMRALSLVKTMHDMGRAKDGDPGSGMGAGSGEGEKRSALKRILLVGCEPETVGPEDGQIGLSEAAQAGVEEAVKIVESLVAEMLGNQRSACAGINPV